MTLRGLAEAAAVLGLLTMILLAGCHTKHIGSGPPLIDDNLTATFVADTSWNAGETATLTVTWTGGAAPYTIAAAMGGGTTEGIAAGTAAVSPFSRVFTLVEGSWIYTVTVTDANDASGTVTGTYTVAAPLNQPPSIDDVEYDGGVLTVHVSDPDGDPVEVTVAMPVIFEPVSYIEQAVDGVATFEIFPTDIIAGASGAITITARDEHGAEDQTTFEITFDAIVVAEGALAAVPAVGAAAVGGEVTVVVISGSFPAGAPFHYMNGVSVTVEEGATYVDGTYNVGAVGGEMKDPDGLWANMSPPPSSFLLPDDFMIVEPPLDDDPALIFIGFNVTPIGGGEVTMGGPLFNFGLTFASAGTYNLGFLEFQDVKRTYYSDSEANEHYWDDISNAGVPNTIAVN